MQKIGIVGAGAMGSGIAQVASQSGHQVVLFDTQKAALETSEKKLLKILARLVEKGKISQEKADAIHNNIEYVENMEAFKDCGLIIEAIIENLEIKKSVFGKLEQIVSDDCILATNTSSLSVTSIAAACEKSERVIGIHFFNPAPLMPLVEIVPAVQTAEQTTLDARNMIDSWGKVTVLAKDTPGFIVNRVARPFYGEAIRILEEGKANIATIDWALTEHGEFRMGPFTLTDFIGHDVNYVVTETVFKEFFYDPRYKPSFSQKRLVEAGRYGRKTGHGFYNYTEGAENPTAIEDEKLAKEIVNRVVLMLINEAADALFLNIATAKDLDLAMAKGVNYPKGLLAWANEWGIENVYNGLMDLYETYHEDRYRPSPILKKMIENGETFLIE
ncbi:MAG: 3-hydroxyacyl-CoA dehydrogenase NAD-binding domain-containing protein [Flavobacteriales bacterium]|jgi:3-hydroxybutyryl-CoA dehydrogenase|nr:3-hydroxyacyl-CoA dehydrogenase NAD-binding domain-containing protein [Flavobacteriales bacterium]